MSEKSAVYECVDDVYTTGATMESAAHELVRAGAAVVTGLTIASGAM